jgi:short-subunit dehydrogenase
VRGESLQPVSAVWWVRFGHVSQGSGVRVQVQFPYFVATKMAKIRHGSIHAPSPKAFAKSVVAATGSSGSAVIPWWFHKIEDALLLSLPQSVLASIVNSMHKGLRKAYLKKLEKRE